MSIAKLRKDQIDLRYKEVPYLKEWLKNPYTCFKARLYIELSAVVIYLCLKLRVQPNTVSVVCAIAYLVAGILIVIPANTCVLIGALIFFFNPALDWTDGALARIVGTSSLSGHLLDVFEAHLGLLCLHSALGFFIANATDIKIFYYLSALIPFFLLQMPIIFRLSILSMPTTTRQRRKKSISTGNLTLQGLKAGWLDSTRSWKDFLTQEPGELI